MKIAFFELEGWEEEMIKAALSGHELILMLEHFNVEKPPAAETAEAEIISVFVDSLVNAETLKYFPNLKLVTTRSTGYDHLDLTAVKAKGAQAAFVPGYGDNTVAEFAFSLILNLSHKTYQAIDRIKETGLFSYEGFRGFDLKGKTIGIIGTGRIGKEAVKIAKGFGMKVLAYDLKPDSVFQQEQGFDYVSLEDLLKNSDVITLHTPYTPQTHHLINKENVSLIKRGAILVNTARGGLVETEALVLALENGILSGVGLDVLEEEGEVKDEMTFLTKTKPAESDLRTALYNHILMRRPNVLITPHTAFNTKEALGRILNTTLENIKSFIAGQPKNLIPDK